MTKQQIDYLTLYEAGYSVKEIAKLRKRNKTTIYRSIKRAIKKECPFSPDCEECPLPDCAINERYVGLLNGNYLKNRAKEK